ncbi:MAG: MGMT family protein [Euryarchaeota archaeon]|nr:MGMT family protein [Euryarchaeota archaeon]
MDEREKLNDLVLYFSGEVVDFSDCEVDLSYLSDFEQKVLLEVRKIPYGSVVTYSMLAERIGRRGAARAVGNALRKNPALVVIPCHRVVAKNGIGGYVLGVDAKRGLLELERRGLRHKAGRTLMGANSLIEQC